MKEFIDLLLHFDINGIFFKPTENGLIKFFRYAFVGGIAFVVDYLSFVLVSLVLPDNNISVVLATTAGFIVGLLVNFVLSKKFVFTEKPSINRASAEFAVYALIGVIGYFLTVLLMMVFIKILNKYIAKIVVSVIVLVYNYIARKKIIY
ncbi:MAG: GtrA family protein [Clostridiales bacterium]|nr:GtrA family protein [Clostridiales bacterium]